jgi:hypothetical protein
MDRGRDLAAKRDTIARLFTRDGEKAHHGGLTADRANGYFVDDPVDRHFMGNRCNNCT